VLGQVGHFIDEGNLGRQHAVGSVLGQLGAARVHEHDFLAVAAEWLIQLAQQLDLGRFGAADDDAVRAHAIIHRRALLEELGVADHLVAFSVGHRLADPRLDTVYRADRRGGLVDDHLGAVGMFENAVDDAEHMAHVGAAIGLGRGADGDEMQPGVLRRFTGIGGEAQAAAGQVLLQ